MLRMQITDNALTLYDGERIVANGFVDEVDMKREVDAKMDHDTGVLTANNGPWKLRITISPRGDRRLRPGDAQIVAGLESSMDANALLEATVIVKHARASASFAVVQWHENSNDQSHVFALREVRIVALGGV